MQIPEPSALAIRYYHSGNLWWIFTQLWNFFVPWLFLKTGASAHARNWSHKRSSNWYVAFVFYFAVFLLYVFAMELPLSFCAGYLREHQFGLSNQLFIKWISDFGKGFIITLIMGSVTLWVPYLLLKKAPHRWWIITGIAAVPYLLFVMMIEPIWIAPMFNHFGRLSDHVLEEKILTLARRAGVESDRVYEVNKSIDTKRINAYVTGFLGTKRIVLWDTLLRELDTPQIVSVMGHEMGHFALHHVLQGVLLTSLLTFLGLFLIHNFGEWVLKRYGPRWGISVMSDYATLPLAILLIQVISFFLTPAGLAFSRHIEHEADRFALEITHDNDAFMRTEAAFVEKDLAYPYPSAWVKYLRYSHPPCGERFDFGRDYKPWERAEPGKYAGYFKP